MNAVKRSKEFTFYLSSATRSLEILSYFMRLTAMTLKALMSDKSVFTEEEQAYIKELDGEATKRMVYEVIISRVVDAFDHYLSQILLRVFTQHPEIFKASEYKADVREFIEAGSVHEFILHFAEKKVNELSYLGLPKVIDFLNNKLGLRFDTTMPEFQSACELIEVRNIIVHNAGRVSKIYLQRTGRTDLREGDLYPLSEDYISEKPGIFSKFVKLLDSQIISHFKLTESG